MQLTEQERRDMVHSYLQEEPTIRVNACTYHLSVAYHEDFIKFFAVNLTTHRLEAIVNLATETWRQLQCGLSVAFAFNAVLEALEHLVARGIGHESQFMVSS